YRDIVFLGYNATFVVGGDLFALSTSKAIGELVSRQNPRLHVALGNTFKAARRYGLKTYSHIHTRNKLSKNDPIFKAHPEISGSLTFSTDGLYNLCTEHPLVRRYLTESVEGIFRTVPQLDGIVLIVGGEGFYHCFTRPYGVKKGHTNCPRCEALGPDTVVANLCNYLTQAARKINPQAEVIAWPYSAGIYWSADMPQTGLINKLKPGMGILTEIAKDEKIPKADGITKFTADYSIDLIGPGDRAKQQVKLCKAAGIPIYMKSEPEVAFEASGLPHIPCMDRWVDRAEALASCGADGAWVNSGFSRFKATTPAELNKFFWWEPVVDKEIFLEQFAKRIAGSKAGSHLRKAWKYVSQAIGFSPEYCPYFRGAHYVGPAHPMCADPKAELPAEFYGQFTFYAEHTDGHAMKQNPIFFVTPRGKVAVLAKFYRKMEELLAQAVEQIEKAEPMVTSRHRMTFDAEALPIRWFYHTARTEANFYESCVLRDRLLALANKPSRNKNQLAEARQKYQRWREIMLDEKANATDALPVAKADMRLDFYYGNGHSFHHLLDVLQAKLKLIEYEINQFLPSIAKKCGFTPPPPRHLRESGNPGISVLRSQ
ncbi:MAG: hypothetical protein ACYTF1_25235, partial [Planctomycetota bacterium]